MYTDHTCPPIGSTTEVMIALHCSASSGRQWDAYRQLLPPGCGWLRRS